MKNKKGLYHKWKGLAVRVFILALTLLGSVSAKAADYVFMYDGGYLAVDNSGDVIYTTTFSPQCVWTCVSNANSLTAAELNTTSRYLYTTDGNGTRRWLIGGTGDGTAVTTSTSAGTARWRSDGTYLYWYQNNNYYVYYRSSQWKTSRRNNGNTYGDGAYKSGNNSGTDYRGTRTAVTTTSVAQASSTTTTVTTPTITPAGAATVNYNASRTFSAEATATATTTTVPAYTTYTFNGNTYYYYNNTTSTAVPTATTTTTNPEVTYSWALSGEANDYLSPTTGTDASITIACNAAPPSDLASTLTLTATANGETSTATTIITAADPRPEANPIAITATNVTLISGAKMAYTNYTLTVTAPVTNKPHNYVSATSSNEGVVTITNNADGTFTINAVANGTAAITINAYGMDNTTVVATTTFTVTIEDPESGVSGEGIVTLNDFEDHNWSYYQPIKEKYSNYPDRMCSPYPRNVKITYYGYGANTLSTSAVAAPAADTFTTNTTSNQVKVGIGEDGHTFVYYKTLERGANNRFPYELIPNPFYVRPSSGTTYTGFYRWRVKSVTGGAIYAAANGGAALGAGSMLEALTTYYFQPTDNAYTNADNALSMEVELEALWAPAEISTNGTFSRGYNSVERNFRILTGTNGSLDDAKVATPCTYTSFYPNGTTSGTTAATLDNRATRTATFTPTADSKVEYLRLNAGDINADARSLTMGRGVNPTGTWIANTFRAINSNKNNDLNFTTRLECGAYNTIIMMADGSTLNGRVQHYMIFGSDYDRATNDDSKLTTGNDVRVRSPQLTNIVNKDQPVFTCVVKSGEIQKNRWTSHGDGEGSYCFYCHSINNNTSYAGLSTITIEGGHFGNIACGRGSYVEGCITDDSLVVSLRMRGGLVENAIYGGASNTAPHGSRRLIFTGGEVRGWIAAGSNGNSGDDARCYGDSYVYIGGNVKVGNAAEPRTVNDTPGGNVFGAGRGLPAQRASVIKSHVAVADNAEVLNHVYGGGYHGYVEDTSNVFVLGGTVHGSVFGGGSDNGPTGTYNRDIPTVNVAMSGGLVEGGVYGGSYTTGRVSTAVNMQIDGGQVGTTSQTANIHGGGYGAATRINGNVDITLGQTGQTTPGVTVYGDVYGGSALGYVNGTAATTTYHTYVTMNKGIINGSLYGGGLGNTTTAANVYGPVAVKVYGGTVNATAADGSGGVYGANNINGAPQRSVTVDIYGTDPAPSTDAYALDAVYGGGNKANYNYGNGYPKVTVHNCDNSINYVYGGGNAADVASTDVKIYGGNVIGNVYGGGNGTASAANVTGNALTNIYGGTILNVFGGSNTSGTIGGTINVNVEQQAEEGHDLCPVNITDLYGGGNVAPSVAGTVTIGCADHIGRVFGGANNANITGNITLNITAGHIDNVFGGNNQGGNISGSPITVNVEDAGKDCGMLLGNVYGGGNEAYYDGSTLVNIKKGTVTGSVFGGGNLADVGSNVTVNVTGGNVHEVYGGGALANTNTTSGTTAVNLTGGKVGTAYGGGLGDADTPAYVNGNVTVTLDGSEIDKIFGCNNINGTPKGAVLVDVKKTVAYNADGTEKAKPAKTDDPDDSNPGTYEVTAVYGGGNLAAYEPTDLANGYAEVLVEGCAASIGTVYGGGNAASTPATKVTVQGAYEIGEVFGGGNGKDQVSYDGGDTYQDNPGANVGYRAYPDGTDYDTRNSVAYTYGTGRAEVTVKGGTIHYVYGGSNTKGNVREIAVAMLEDEESCDFEVDEAYGGGKSAPMDGEARLDMRCIPGLRAAYGGSRNADVNSNVTLNITNGTFARVFGGNNEGGCIKGSITVNIEETGCRPVIIGELYGGGNMAGYSVYGYNPNGTLKDSGEQIYDDPQVNLKSFASIGTVYGGGYGETATVVGNPTVSINEVEGDHASDDMANIAEGSRVVRSKVKVAGEDGYDKGYDIPSHEKDKIGAVNTVFGGGNAARVIGNTTVNIGTEKTINFVTKETELTVKGVDIRGNVYGGGNSAEVTGDTKVNIGVSN